MNKRFAHTAGNWVMALSMIAVLLFSAVSPAHAAGGTIQSITVGAQGSPLTYGTGGSASFTVTVSSTGTVNNAVFNVAGLPAGATGAFLPTKLSFSGAQTKSTTLTITTSATTPAGATPFNVGYKVQGKAGTTIGSGTLTVGQLVLDVQGKLAQDKVYDANVNATLNPDCGGVIGPDCAYLVGMVNSDVVTLNTGTGHGIFASKDVGTQDVAVTGLTLGGAGASNYALPATVMASAVISKAMLGVKSNDAFMIVGGSAPAFTFTYSGFMGSEDGSVIDAGPVCDVPGQDYSLGTHSIVCSGASDNNYDFTYDNSGILTVNEVNNPPTDINLSNSSVAENQPAGSLVGNLTTVDADSGLGETYSYSLASGVLGCDGSDNASFQVSALPSAGPVPLETAAPLHFMTKSSYSICVETNDGNGGTFDKHFTISVLASTASFVSNFGYDGWVLESGENTGVGGSKNNTATTLRVGDDAANKQYRSILYFPTGGLPDNAVIYQITLKIRKQGQVGAANLVSQLQGVRIDIKKPSFGLKGLELSDFQAPVGTSGKLGVGKLPALPDGSGWYSVTLGAGALPYLNKTGPTQLRLRFYKDDNNNHIADYLSLFSGNAGLLSRPQLIITYSVP